jgi:hypothetical protein
MPAYVCASIVKIGVLVIEPDPRRNLRRILVSGGAYTESQPRRNQRPPHNLIPIESQPRLNQPSLRRLPPVLHVRANLAVVHRERRRRRKHALPLQRSVLAQITHRRPRLSLVISNVVHVQSRLHIVPPHPLPRRQIQRRRSLPVFAIARSDSQNSCPPSAPACIRTARSRAARIRRVCSQTPLPNRAARPCQSSAGPAHTASTQSCCVSPCSAAA